MLEYILIFILNILILLLLFKKDDLYSFFLSEKNDQTQIKADRLISLASALFIFIALLSTREFSGGLIYTIGLLFSRDYIPDNYWTNLVILLTTGGVFYNEYKNNDGTRSATILLCILALLAGYKGLDPVYMGIAAFLSFVYLIINMCELKISSMSDILLSYVGRLADKFGLIIGPTSDVLDPNTNYTGFSILLCVTMLIIIAIYSNGSATVLALSLVSLSIWVSTWFKYTDEKRRDEIKGLKETMKKIIPVFFLVATIVQVIPFSYMTTGLKWTFIAVVTVISGLLLVNAFTTKTSSNTPSTNIFIKEQLSTVPTGTYQVLGATLVAFASYFGAPIAYKFVNEFIQGGKVLLREPVHLDKPLVLSTYKEMNKGKENFNYQYGISSYIYLDANNTNDYYQTILDYGGKPRIQYNGAQNSLQITVLDDYDKEKVVLTLPRFELQKWHHLAVNYVGGNLDVFLDGELIKSVNNVVPYMTLDDLIVGSQNEEFVLNGGIKDVVYFDKPLTQTNLFFLSTKW